MSDNDAFLCAKCNHETPAADLTSYGICSHCERQIKTEGHAELVAERDALKGAIEQYVHAVRRMVAPFAKEGPDGFQAGGRLQADSDQHGAAYGDLLKAAGIEGMNREDLK